MAALHPVTLTTRLAATFGIAVYGYVALDPIYSTKFPSRDGARYLMEHGYSDVREVRYSSGGNMCRGYVVRHYTAVSKDGVLEQSIPVCFTRTHGIARPEQLYGPPPATEVAQTAQPEIAVP